MCHPETLQLYKLPLLKLRPASQSMLAKSFYIMLVEFSILTIVKQHQIMPFWQLGMVKKETRAISL
jgi:hypothetical protein